MPSTREQTDADPLAVAMQSVLCYVLLIAAAYFLINGLLYRVDGDPFLLPLLSFISAAVCLGFWYYNRLKATMLRLEITGHVVSAFLIANAMLDIILEYHAIKLMYLLLLLPAFAVCGVRPRVVLPASFLVVAGFLGAAWRYDPQELEACFWVAFAGLVIGFGLSTIMRSTMMKAVQARLLADRLRDEALSLATLDALTGLPNRRAFMTTLTGHLSADRRFFLGLVDLDGFKPINDIYGHAAGDRVLVEVARRLVETCGKDAIVARLGGDEFALILPDLPDTAAWRTLADEVCHALAMPYALDQETAHLSASLGFTLVEPETAIKSGIKSGTTPSRLLERADYALYEAKEQRRGMAVLFDGGHEALIRSTKAVEQALRSLDAASELTLAFQPQIDIVNNRVVALEALARWKSSKLGQVSPDIFIRAAERSGLITSLTPVLLAKALHVARTWPEHIRLAFNLSVRDLLSPVAVQRLATLVAESGLAPARIEFEITETAMVTDFVQAHKGISILRDLGCRIALDDFGSGYTNFSYINQVQVDTVKIDRSFVLGLAQNTSSPKIIKSIIELAGNLGMDHVVEGVETLAELQQLRDAGATHVQGYLFRKPMDEAELSQFIDQALRIDSLLAA
ncbi:MAG: EAL domain-containing protein [Asticcacaulis sp.]|uniref:putative bifunctional diguanylate cyclase/phosphodiesterase n=1 Tax=Asticcacaulis sp. TaxID=1872648 RepID=UPI0039E2F52F